MSDRFPIPPRLGRETPASPPRRPALTQERIVEAALAIVDSEGVEGLSMRQLAEAVGTGAASLYAHVESREALLDLLVDRALGEAQFGAPRPPAEWAAELKDLLREARRAFNAHGDIARATFGRVPMGPNSLRLTENLVRILRAADLPPKVVGLAPDLIALHLGAVCTEEGMYAVMGVSEKQLSEYFDAVHNFFTNVPKEQYPNLAAAAQWLTGFNEDDQRFEFGVEVMVRGLAAIASDRAEPPH